MPDSTRVNIHGGQMPLVVKLEVDTNPVDVRWLESFLALRKNHVQVCRNSRLEMVRFQICGPKEVGEDFLRLSSQLGKARSYQEETCQDSRSELTAKDKAVETSSTSEEDHGGKVFSESYRERGECSKKLDQIGVVDSTGPELSSKPKKVYFRLSSEGPSSFMAINTNERVDFCVDLGQVAVRPMDVRRSVGMDSRKEVAAIEDRSPSDSLATKEELVQATIEVER
ncbi:hypothetical protein LWI29_035906 [Acer saccharum]|uniref:Uncharacterized protein n=1 Tax=Acer saccharum TaxID=4024 RepID=A0AA39SEA7_ACESA|nr:hypothetical protein LWI29_035906 [Acer saccharum]